MFRNYLKIAFRNLTKHKLFALINIGGLALSMSVCLIVLVSTREELRIDSFNPAPDNTFRITSKLTNPAGQSWLLASSPLPLAAELQRDSTLVDQQVMLYPALHSPARAAQKEIELQAALTSPSLFNIFGFTLQSGNAASALTLPNSIVLSEAVANKYFGEQPALGKTIIYGNYGSFMVTGVLAPTPSRSHVAFDAYVSLSSLPALEKNKLLPERSASWNSFENAYTYVTLQPGKSADELQAALDRLTAQQNQGQGSLRFIVQPFSKITPGSDDLYNDISRGATWGKILGPIAIALIILIAACFNYTNLSIVRSLSRAKEVGIRKVSGAHRGQIFLQYILEAIILACFALLLAGILGSWLVSAGIFSEWPQHFDFQVLLLFFGFAVFTGLLAGALPAWVLSSFKPAEILKNIGLNRLFGNLNLRRSLIVFQLVLSLVTCIFLLSFYRQFEHMGRKADYDHRTANVMSIPLNGAEAPLLQRELANLGAVRRTATASANIGRRNDNSINVNDTRLNYWAADTGIVSLLKLQLVAGRNNVQPNEALINEKAVAALGYKRPDDALGQSVRVNDSTQMTIAGVLRDFMYENVGRNLAPLIIANEGTPQRYLLVQTQGNRAQSARLANEVWSRLYPAQAFEFSWLDEDIRQRNSQADTVSQISYLAFMTIVIAALGLLAMVIYTTETRRREISIRKVMGANVRHLLWLLSKGFVKLLIIAGGIALPLGYVLSALFLQNFADRASIGIGSLLLCLGIMLLIALSAVLSQTWRAASANPADNLRND